MNIQLLRTIRPLLILFVILTAFFILGRDWLSKQGVDHQLLLAGNLVIFIATILALIILLRGGKSSNPQSFVRGMYGSVMVRFFLILIAAFIYIMMVKKNVNKPGLITLAVLFGNFKVI